MCCTCSNDALPGPIQFYIGDGGALTPVAGTDKYVNPLMKYKAYLIEKNGFGAFIEGRDYERLSQGGFKLPSPKIFSIDETYTITFYKPD